MVGSRSQARKISALAAMIRAAHGSQIVWLVRTLEAHLGVGVSLEASVLPALAAAYLQEQTPAPQQAALQQARSVMRDSFARCPHLERLVEALLCSGQGFDGVRSVSVLSAGIPPQPMLATPARQVQEVIEKLLKDRGFAAEFKYDGQRFVEITREVHTRELTQQVSGHRSMDFRTERFGSTRASWTT
jgi:ATP-dependent DNA ligase